MIRDQPGRDTYRDLQNLDGDRLNLPTEPAHHPLPKFLTAHRELNGFE